MLDLSYILEDMKGTENMTKYVRHNRFSGESIELTREEAKKHDEIFYHEALATTEDKLLGEGMSKHWQEMRDRLDWFIKNNAKAYMVLLDQSPETPAPLRGAGGEYLDRGTKPNPKS